MLPIAQGATISLAENPGSLVRFTFHEIPVARFALALSEV